MVRALLNIAGVTAESLVLDPYGGSGTTSMEASLLGANSISVDLSPLCVLLTRVKTQSVNELPEIRRSVCSLLKDELLDPFEDTKFNSENPTVADFLKIAQMVTFSDASRRKREPRVSIRRNLKGMLDSVEAHDMALREFGIKPGAGHRGPGGC